MNAPRHAGSLDPLEFSLVEFCQLVDFLLDIVSLVSFFLSWSVPYIFLISSFLVFTLFIQFCIMFLTFFHWFNCHLYIGFNFKPFSPFSLPLFSIFISLVSHSLLGQT